ncbi:MAG: polysaccharide deacetylase family protein [Phycisphaerales bacterium]|nr:polysaccharide deacetylase family protein [Phycisphaerales bacterium]
MDSDGFATHSRDLQLVSFRETVRRYVIEADSWRLARSGELATALARPRVHFIYLHHVFDDEIEGFRRTLAEIQKTHHFVTYSQAVELVYAGNVDKPTVCVSFDDGLLSTLQASRVMDELGIKGCFFVCPAIVGEKKRAVVKRFAETRLQYPAMDVLDWSQCEDMLRRGHEIGSHTYSHPNMGDVSVEQAIDELQYSKEHLVRRLGGVSHFAWPSGRWANFGAHAAKAVFDLGYRSVASAVRGCHMPRATPVLPRQACLRRDHVMGSWPLHHNMYFLARSVRRAGPHDYEWPRSWMPTIMSERAASPTAPTGDGLSMAGAAH